ncbi:acetyltransferase [Myroides phaeus]|uniref:acetyltransferase n=1 Tax=Myroides phaeus TaxID=702745 RepID=UPI002DBB9498|nr:acetyltransferase [Myroides phaeus]MEC4117212.1 acetyltransferase [Myroides phaeus]
MIRKVKVVDYPRLMEIWESAVVNTHDFLHKEDFEYYKANIPTYFQYVNLYVLENASGVLVGFMGIAEESLEMLFIDNAYRGQGVGKQLLRYAVEQMNVSKVDVNEQNTQGVGFYLHYGFTQIGRSELDDQGKAYPILHLALSK